MTLLLKCSCLLRRDRTSYVNSCRFICNLNKSFLERYTKGYFGNRLLLCTRPETRSTRSTCILSSIPSLHLGQGIVDPENSELLKRNSSSASALQEEKSEDFSGTHLKQLQGRIKWSIDRGHPVYKADIESIMQLLEHQEGNTSASSLLGSYLVLLRGCGDLMPHQVPTARFDLTNLIWDNLLKRGLSPNVQTYNALLRSHLDNKQPTSPFKFLEEMKVSPNAETYHLLLWCTCEAGNLEQAMQLIARMKSENVSINETVFNALVYGYALTSELASALSVFETMQSAQLPPSSDTYTALLRGLARCGNIEQMHKTFKDATVDVGFSVNQILSVFISLATSGHETAIPSVLRWLPRLERDGVYALKNVLIQLTYLGHDDAVKSLVIRLPSEDDTEPFGQLIVRQMVQANRPTESILSFCKLVSEWNPLALTYATGIALKMAKTDLASDLLKAMKEAGAPLRPHFFWPLLSAAKPKGDEEVFTVLRLMQELDVTIDTTTLYTVLSFISLSTPTALVLRLQDLGLTVSEILSPLVCTFISDGRLNEALKLCGEYTAPLQCRAWIVPLTLALRDGGDLQTIVKLVKVCVDSSEQPDDWTGLFLLKLVNTPNAEISVKSLMGPIQALGEAGLRCSSWSVKLITHAIMEQITPSKKRKDLIVALSRMEDPNLKATSPELAGENILHPREMNVEQLDCHLEELKAKDMNTRGVLRRLLQLACRNSDLTKALEIKQMVDTAGYKFSFGMESSLFALYVKKGMIDEAEAIYRKLTENNFVLDEYKVIDFAALLVTHKRDEMALAMLRSRSKDNIRGSSDTVRNCWTLLQATALRGDTELARKMLACLSECGYAVISNVLLGPLVRSHINRNDLEGAVRELQFCVTNYRFTPLAHELTTALLRAPDDASEDKRISLETSNRLIQDVLACMESKHGPNNTLILLLVALAEVGKIEQLERLVKDSGRSINQASLKGRCERLVKEDKLETLQNIVAVFKQYRWFDMSPYLEFLLQIHSRRGDCRGALALWNMIEEMHCEPGLVFRTMLSDFLTSHNYPVPPRVLMDNCEPALNLAGQ